MLSIYSNTVIVLPRRTGAVLKYFINSKTDLSSMMQVIMDDVKKIGDSVISINLRKTDRSIEQNRLAFLWYEQAEKQGDMTRHEHRAYCKLHHGVPILRAEDEEFRVIYDETIRPLSYEQKLRLMVEPIDLPVTSRMTVEQMQKYLDVVYNDYTTRGFKLTIIEK